MGGRPLEEDIKQIEDLDNHMTNLAFIALRTNKIDIYYEPQLAANYSALLKKLASAPEVIQKAFDHTKTFHTSAFLAECHIPEDKYISLQDCYYYLLPGNQPRLLVPHNCREPILTELHASVHKGPKHLRQLVKEFFYWPGLSKHTSQLCKYCPDCCKHLSTYPPKHTGFMIDEF